MANKSISDFFKKKKEAVASVQKEIASNAMEQLYESSPHMLDQDSPYATGQYESNHKVSVNDEEFSALHPSLISEFDFQSYKDIQKDPSFFQEIITEQRLQPEKDRLEKVKCGDSVTITNPTPHAYAVETGDDPQWHYNDGYHPYSNTKEVLKGRYKNVLK